MINTLAEICTVKREDIARRKQEKSEQQLLQEAIQTTLPRGFAQSLHNKASAQKVGLIAEIKKASPSKGLIRVDFDPKLLAKAYTTAGASCISVLTDTPYFQGCDADLVAARSATNLPVLRKDFMLEPYQILESRALGADCILLILAALDDAQAAELESLAHELGMDVLLEVHDKAELDRALKLKSPLIGVNNRNLKTLEVTLDTSQTLATFIPENRIAICESGIKTNADIRRMQQINIHCFLVGESLMSQADIIQATRNLLG